MRGLRGSPSLVFFACSSSSVLGLESSPAYLFSSGRWPFSVIQRVTGKGSENLTVEPENHLLCPSQQSEIQLLHTLLLRLTFFHTSCFNAFCFPSHCSNSHLLKLATTFSSYTSVNLEQICWCHLDYKIWDDCMLQQLEPKPMSLSSASFSLLLPISKRDCCLGMVILIIRLRVKLHNLPASTFSRCFTAIN